MSQRPERIGLLGGTFDPPHLGHLAAAQACLEAVGLDRVLMVVANNPWQKTVDRPITPAEDRLALVAAATGPVEHIDASSIEIDRGGPSYTIETVEQLRSEAQARDEPSPELFVVIGADLIASLPTWERVDELRHAVTLVVVSRPRSPRPVPPDGWRCQVVDGPGVDVSSSEIRDLLSRHKSVEGLVPEDVIRCIRRRDLYAVG